MDGKVETFVFDDTEQIIFAYQSKNQMKHIALSRSLNLLQGKTEKEFLQNKQIEAQRLFLKVT
jgi:hypothetical protein